MKNSIGHCFVDMQTHWCDVRFLCRCDYNVVVTAYFKGIDMLRPDHEEYHWHQLTLHLVALAVYNLLAAKISFVIDLYVQLVQLQTNDGVGTSDFRTLRGNVFLLEFYGEIDKGLISQEWRSEVDKSARLLNLLASLHCDKAMVVYMLRCSWNKKVARRMRSVLFKVATSCGVGGCTNIDTQRNKVTTDSVVSELYSATAWGEKVESLVLHLLEKLE